MEENAWTGVMQAHAKSFHLASLFFPKDIVPKVQALYALCRWIDDAADEAPSVDIAKRQLDAISDDLIGESKMDVCKLYKSFGLDVGYIVDLIDGARQDLDPVRIPDEASLVQYSYKVAGAVGLAMSDLMQVADKRARAFAVDLGVAMQITNICRDVKEDLENDRIYVPKSYLDRHNTSIEHPKLAVKDLLKLADAYYFSAKRAFPAIPMRARGAIIVASQLYRGIGQKLDKSWGADPMRGRCMLSFRLKALHVISGLSKWGASVWKRAELEHDKHLHEPLQHWAKLRGF